MRIADSHVPAADSGESVDPEPAQRPAEVVAGTSGGAIRVRATGGVAWLDPRRWRELLLEHADAAALVTITAIAAGVRFSTLGVQSFDHDESVTAARVLQPSLAQTLAVVAQLERNPPLYYVVAWLWAKVLGTGQVDLRLLSAIAGTLTVPVAFLAGRELASRRAGLVAAALVALNPFLVWYSQEARSYAFLVLFSTLALFLFARALRSPTRRGVALWALASILALSSHYFAVFAIVPEGLWLIAKVRPRRWALGAVGTTAAAGFALLPLAVEQEGSGRGNGFATHPVLERGWQTLAHFVSSASPRILTGGWAVSAGLAALALAAAAIAIALRHGAGAERRGALVVAGVAVGAFAGPLILALVGVDYMDARNLIISLPPFLIAAGIAYGSRRAGAIGLAAAAGACVLFAAILVAVNLSPGMQRPDWRGLAEAIGPAPVPRVIVSPRLGKAPLEYYLRAGDLKSGTSPVATRRLDMISARRKVTPPGPPFHLASVRSVGGSFWLWLYRSPHPAWLRHVSRGGDGLIHQASASLVTGAS